MPLSQKFLWGLLAGMTIVFVKILGPDQYYVKLLFENFKLGNFGFYVFISVITVLLGAISGLFSKEDEPVKLLVFCASVPALLSTYTAEKRDTPPPPAGVAQTATQDSDQAVLDGVHFPSLIISSAHAQTPNDPHVCKEGGFTAQFTRSAEQYLSGEKSANQPFYAVVVASTQDFTKARQVANDIYAKNSSWAPYVGCRKPGNAYYPVIVGPSMNQVQAAELRGRFEAAKILRDAPYLSYYEYRVPIFTPK